MTDTNKAKAKTEPARVSVTVTDEAGVTFARKDYKKGETIHCTAEQVETLKAQGVISNEVNNG